VTSITFRAYRCAVLAGVCLWLSGAPSGFAQTTGTAAQAPAATATAEDIIGKLQQGGYVVYIRHTETDSATKDGDLSDLSDCSKQRILSKTGQENAVKLGEAIKAVKLPADPVLTSQFCRAKETAKLMGFDSAVETPDINSDNGEPVVSKEESQRRAAALRKLLATPPAAGKNTVIVGHVPNIREAAGQDYNSMKEGEIAVFAPKAGEPGYDAVGRVTPDALKTLAQTASK
jgi:phosphohistidine phosphatase SixA